MVKKISKKKFYSMGRPRTSTVGKGRGQSENEQRFKPPSPNTARQFRIVAVLAEEEE